MEAAKLDKVREEELGGDTYTRDIALDVNTVSNEEHTTPRRMYIMPAEH